MKITTDPTISFTRVPLRLSEPGNRSGEPAVFARSNSTWKVRDRT